MHFQILDIDIGIILLTKLKTSCIVQQFLHTFIFDVLYSAVKWNCITWIDLSNNCCNRDTNLFHCQKEIFFCLSFVISSVQLLSHARLSVTPWATARQASLSITNSRSSPKLMCIESVMPIQPSHPLSSPSPPAPNPSKHQGLFQWVNSAHEVAKVLEFQP